MVLISLAEENQERGGLFIQRIACGAGVEYELTSLMADALSLTNMQIGSFAESFVSIKLRTGLTLACMMVYLICEHTNKKC